MLIEQCLNTGPSTHEHADPAANGRPLLSLTKYFVNIIMHPFSWHKYTMHHCITEIVYLPIVLSIQLQHFPPPLKQLYFWIWPVTDHTLLTSLLSHNKPKQDRAVSTNNADEIAQNNHFNEQFCTNLLKFYLFVKFTHVSIPRSFYYLISFTPNTLNRG
jgi:hypothetical protein